jgi:hypothetical protein
MSSKRHTIISILLCIIISCKQKSKNPFFIKEKEVSSLSYNINHIIDSMSASFPSEYPVNLYIVSHQKKYGKHYIKISTSEYFNRDSLSNSYLHKGKVIISYSSFFNKKVPNNYFPSEDFEWDDEKISLYHKRFIICEIVNNKLKKVTLEKNAKRKLFDYSDINICEIPPTRNNKK